MRLPLALLATASLLAVSLTASAAPAAAVAVSRIAGADRFATSVEISRQTPSPGDVVYLASGLSFPDALAAGPVAAAEGGHLLLTRPDAVDPVVMERIAELSPSEIVLVGSAATVRDSVRAQLATAFPATELTRIGGSDRVGTSLELLDRLAESGPVRAVWVVSGWSFPDALIAASVAGATGAGIVLDYHGADPASARAWAERLQPYVQGVPVSIAGGAPSVSDEDELLLAEHGAVDIVRHAGMDRYDTARIINDAYPVDPGVRSMLVATGQNFPDALGGAVLAAATGMPLYLSPSMCHSGVTPMLAAEAAERGIGTAIGLGSAASVSELALSMGECPVPNATQASFAGVYGSFDPVQASGTGGAIIAMPPNARVGAVSTSQRSHGTLRAYTVGADGSPIELVADPDMVTPSGHQVGRRAFGLGGGPLPTHLYIETDGDWSVTIHDMRSVPVGEPGRSGMGDDVWLFPGGVPHVNYSYMGGSPERGFELTARPLGSGGTTLVAVSGAASGRVTAPAAPAVMTVRSSGQWTLIHLNRP
ncbi:cell wall-binding repeat-containing protein [Agrococcus beijingensis]|uniref:cell wall-binding repeat-containing protein n=1 Tax=Agrococcus beijingensis TaxID=3068634 RepID=UPI0027405325|nr:cell wall-binding repeat-containing protein [Agrococcus sp. REN33]